MRALRDKIEKEYIDFLITLHDNMKVLYEETGSITINTMIDKTPLYFIFYFRFQNFTRFSKYPMKN